MIKGLLDRSAMKRSCSRRDTQLIIGLLIRSNPGFKGSRNGSGKGLNTARAVGTKNGKRSTERYVPDKAGSISSI